MNGKVTSINNIFKAKIKEKDINNLTKSLMDKIKNFIQDTGDDDMEIFSSTFLLDHISKSYHLDVAKYKAFHDYDDTDIDPYKVASYLVKWIIKIKPILVTKQGNNSKDLKKSLIINELFAFELACTYIGIYSDKIDIDLHERIIYNLHYRDFNVNIFNLLLENLDNNG